MKMQNKGGRFQLGTTAAVSDFFYLSCRKANVMSFLWCPLLCGFFSTYDWSWQLFPVVEDFYMSQFNDCSWLGERRKRRRRERLCLKACVWVPVSLSQCPVMPPLNPAKTRSEHPGCIQGDEKQTVLYKLLRFGHLIFPGGSWLRQLFRCKSFVMIGLLCMLNR